MTRFAALLLCVAVCASAEDLHEIVKRCVETLQKSNRLREDYTYKETETNRELNGNGSVKATHATVKQIMYFAGVEVEQVVQKDGKPLPPDEAQREQRKVDRAALEASKLTTAESHARWDKTDREIARRNAWLLNVPDAYSFTLLREQILNGRPVYVLRAEPKPEYTGKDSALFRRVRGTFYIDKELYSLAHMDAEFLDSYSIGLFLGKIQKGTRLSFEQVRVNNEIWLPKDITYKAQARALVKNIREEGEIAFSDYQKFRTDARVISTRLP